MSILLHELITNAFKMRLMAWYWLEPILLIHKLPYANEMLNTDTALW